MRFGTFSYNQARSWIPERQAFVTHSIELFAIRVMPRLAAEPLG